MKSPERGTGGGPAGIDPPPGEGTAEALTRGKPWDRGPTPLLRHPRVGIRETWPLLDLAALLYFLVLTRCKLCTIPCIKQATAADERQ